MGKLIRVVKTDGSQHFLPLAAKAQLQQQNNLLPESHKWKIDEVDESLAKGHKFIADGHVSAQDAGKVIVMKDTRIKELEAQLAAFKAAQNANKPDGAGAGTGANADEKKPKPYTAMNKGELTAEIEKRRANGRVIDTTEAKTNPDLVNLLKADDEAQEKEKGNTPA